MLRWISIRWAKHVIDFHPVTFHSGICDVQTVLLPPPLLLVLLVCLFLLLCVNIFTYMHFITVMGNKYDLCDPFEDTCPRFFTEHFISVGRKWCTIDTWSLSRTRYSHYIKIWYNKLHLIQTQWGVYLSLSSSLPLSSSVFVASQCISTSSSTCKLP